MNATAGSAFLDATQLHYLATNAPLYYTPSTRLVSSLPDHLFALALPVIAYWGLSGVFQLLDVSGWKWLDRYRLHESAEVRTRNLVTPGQVLWAVILQHAVQTVLGYWWIEVKPVGAEMDHVANMLSLARPISQVAEWVLGKDAAAQFLATKGAEALYAVYWWAIPTFKFVLGMYVPRLMHVDTPLTIIAGSSSTHGNTSCTEPCT